MDGDDHFRKHAPVLTKKRKKLRRLNVTLQTIC